MPTDYNEPWEVSIIPIETSSRTLKHAILDRYNDVVSGSGEKIHKINRRVVTCVNFLRGIENESLWSPQDVVTSLMLACIAAPTEATPRMMLLDELVEWKDSVEKDQQYVSREKLIDLLRRIGQNVHPYVIGETHYEEIIRLTGFPCPAGVFDTKGIRYQCKDGITCIDPEKPVRCPVCKGLGKVLSLTESKNQDAPFRPNDEPYE